MTILKRIILSNYWWVKVPKKWAQISLAKQVTLGLNSARGSKQEVACHSNDSNNKSINCAYVPCQRLTPSMPEC